MNNITKIAEMFAELIAHELEENPKVTNLEQVARSLLQEVGRRGFEKLIQSKSSRYPVERVVGKCGGEAKYVRIRGAVLRTLLGRMEVKRAYYLCGDCHKGYFPLDEEFGLRPNALSAELERLVAMTGIQMPFETGSELFEALTLVSVSDQTMGKATRAIGQVVVVQEEAQQQQSINREELLRQKRQDNRPTRLYGAIDATKVHIREKKEYGWRDLKIGAWFEAQALPPTTPDGEWSIRAENIHYYTDICTASEFSKLVWSSAVAQRAQLAQELIILGDGAEWIWNIVTENFPDAVQILDWFHASEHLMPVAQAAFSEQEKQLEWVIEMKQLLWDGDIETIIEDIDLLARHCTHDILRTTANYFRTHQNRMAYADFRQRGYLIGSGTIESAAKQIGIMRMKVPGATWNQNGARLVSKARAAFLSDRWLSLPIAA